MSDTPCSRQLGWQVSSCWRGRGIDADHLAFCSWHAVHHRRRFFDIDSAFGCSQLLVYPVRLRANSAGLRVVAVSELRNRLAEKGGDGVMVEYNVFSDFGHEQSYNVRSVDGLLLADGRHAVKDAERFGGQMLTDNSRPPNCW
jgi:hypothetical protein